MVDLIAFLRARLDERERAAHAATPGPWSSGVDNVGDPYIDGANGHLIADLPFCHGQDDRRELDAVHIASHDPAYVLADVAAKRRIVALCQVDFNDDGQPICLGGYGEAYWDVVRLLALPYADHPDYRQEWRP